YWELRGRIRRAIAVPDKLHLGTVSVSSPSASAQTVPLLPIVRIARVEVESAGSALLAAVRDVGPGRGRGFALTVSPMAGLEKRHYATAVRLTPVLERGDVLPPVRIPVEFDV